LVLGFYRRPTKEEEKTIKSLGGTIIERKDYGKI
jgi:hypothetical protein